MRVYFATAKSFSLFREKRFPPLLTYNLPNPSILHMNLERATKNTVIETRQY